MYRNLQELGKLIKDNRDKKKIGNRTFAKMIGVFPTDLARIENGSQRIDYNTAIRIANVLEISQSEILILSGNIPDNVLQAFAKLYITYGDKSSAICQYMVRNYSVLYHRAR